MVSLSKLLDNYNLALVIVRELKDRSGEAVTLNNIGNVYNSIGKPTEALNYLQQALPIRKEVGDRSGEAVTLNNIGVVYRSIGKPTEALKYYQQALPIRKEVGDRRGEATTFNNIGNVYNSIGKPTEALNSYQQALPIFKEVGDRRGEATILNNIGEVYQSIGKPTEALNSYQQALPIRKEVGDRSGEAATLNNIGFVYYSIGKPTEALNYYQQALPISKEVGDRSGEATTLNNIGAVYYSIGKPTEALNSYQQALPIRKEVGDRSGEATTLSNIGAVYRDTNQPEKAISYYEESVKITLDIRKGLSREHRKQFIEAEKGTAYGLIDLLIKQKQPEKAFEYANLVTTFDLADYTRLINVKVSNPEAQKAIDQWNEKNQQLQYLRQQLDQKFDKNLSLNIQELKAETNKLAENMINQYPEVAELFEANPTAINQLRQNIPIDTVVIQPVFLTNIDNVPDTLALFIHLGTHGCFLPDGCQPLGMKPNTILFANNQQFPLADAALLGLENTEMITLSACQTAKEITIENPGLAGLAYVLERAGSKSVLASLWNAEDEATQQIMIDFYANLKTGMSKPEAMQKAKLKQIERHPWFWDPFILIGN